MADYVRHRLIAAKVGVSMAVLGFLGGVAAKAGSQHDGAVEARLAADVTPLAKAANKIPAGAIESKQVQNGSLLYKDFKSGQVLSAQKVRSQFLKKDQASSNYLKIDEASHKYLKIEDANHTFLKVGGTAANANKLDGIGSADLVHGQGSVLSNLVELGTGDPAVSLLTAPGLVDVTVDGQERGRVLVRNLSSAPIELLGTLGGNSLQPATVEPGATHQVAIGVLGQTLTLQVIPGQGGLPVGTFTLSALGGPDTRPQFVGQAIVGPQ